MKQAVVDRGARITGRYGDPASSAGVVSPSDHPVDLDEIEGNGRAVLVERADHSCVLYRGGPVGEWPSLRHAWATVRAIHPELEWRRSTPGVWIGAPGSGASESDGASPPAPPGRAEMPDGAGRAGGTFTVARMVRDDRRTIRA